ncbi:hypothetical protein OIU74_005178 [Salix koriyanagi]|uniref:Uncharacterized protein n=1 Tax=Salix koriyanagi TaxID=2511006 RepID=A0A9Q0UNS7_9ROSI|nr:hypothetical protein OIU74_005178 [Salix koriyanagi]
MDTCSNQGAAISLVRSKDSNDKFYKNAYDCFKLRGDEHVGFLGRLARPVGLRSCLTWLAELVAFFAGFFGSWRVLGVVLSSFWEGALGAGLTLGVGFSAYGLSRVLVPAGTVMGKWEGGICRWLSSKACVSVCGEGARALPLQLSFNTFPLLLLAGLGWAGLGWAGLVWVFGPNIGPCVFGLLPWAYAKFWVGFLLLLAGPRAPCAFP